MKYYSFNEPDDNDGNVVVTLSEDDIFNEYYPYWYVSMCKKFGKDHVDKTFSFRNCIDDWIVTHWAWEKTNG